MTDENRPMDAETYDARTYKEYITGAPEGIHYRVEDPGTGLVYNFDAFAGGRLIYVIARYGDQFDDVSPNHHTPAQDYTDTANLQVAVSQGYPITWCVQSAADADKIRDLLGQAGFPQIDVVHRP